jgi:thiol-disulfide isomerase/thioredoxin
MAGLMLLFAFPVFAQDGFDFVVPAPSAAQDDFDFVGKATRREEVIDGIYAYGPDEATLPDNLTLVEFYDKAKGPMAWLRPVLPRLAFRGMVLRRAVVVDGQSKLKDYASVGKPPAILITYLQQRVAVLDAVASEEQLLKALEPCFDQVCTLAEAKKQPVLLYYTADYCGPCLGMKTDIETLRLAGYPIKIINVTADQSLMNSRRVQTLPTFILTVGGQEKDRVVGAVPKSKLETLFKEVR